MPFFPGISRSRSEGVRIGAATVSLLFAFSMTAGCASRPPTASMAPGPTIDHGFPGVSVSGGESQWPRIHGPEAENSHRIYTFVPVFLPAYLAEIKIGALILNVPVQVPNIRALSRMPKEAILAQVKIVLYPFVVGSGLFALGAFLLSFPTIYLLIRWIKARRHPSPP